MRHVPIFVLVLALSLTQAERETEVQKSGVTKLEVVDLGDAEIESDPRQSDVQRKRDSSGYSYNRPNRVLSSDRFRYQANQSRKQIASTIPGQLSRPFTKYGPPSQLTSSTTTHGHNAQQQHRNKLQHHVSPQQSISFNSGLMKQEIPSPIRNVDFAESNPIASQNNEPFGMHTANYLPPQNQKLPVYSSADNFAPPNLVQPQNHQISDAALFLSENAQAIQQLYGAPASTQDFSPGYEQFQNTGNQVQSSSGQFRTLENVSQNFQSALPSYASGMLSPHERTLEQIQSLEKDRLIAQLQQALAQTQATSSAEAAGRYAQDQASFVQNQELLASISQQMKLHVPTTPQTVAFGTENTAFSQSPFLPGTTVNPLGLPLSYGAPTTAQTPITTTVAATPSEPPQPSGGTVQATSSLPTVNQPGSPATGSPAAGSPVGIPIYGGFVPTFIAGTNFVPSYSTSVFASGPVRPIQSTGSSPTHFGIPIPTISPEKPTSASAPSIPTMTTPSSVSPPNRPAIALTPAIALPVQPIRPVATPIQPVAAPLHPVLPPQVQATPAGAYPTYGLQTALINPPVIYKPIKTIYPIHYYPNIAYPLQKPALPSYPWSYAPSYAQAKPAQIWK